MNFNYNKAPVTRYRIRIGAISILGVFQSCLLLKLSIFDVFCLILLYYHNFKSQSHLETVKFDVAPMRIRYRVTGAFKLLNI